MAGHEAATDDGLRVDHHFVNADQQYQSAKLGMWLFLATEILFFGGLFVAYSVYRANHPEIFVFGHHFLDKNLGALNTVILICSSLTAAWAVRAAQLRQIRLLKLMLVLTMVCAFGFMGIKGVEYTTKWKHGLLWAGSYDPHLDHDEATVETVMTETTETPAGQDEVEVTEDAQRVGDSELVEAQVDAVEGTERSAHDDVGDRSTIAPAAQGPSGLAQPGSEPAGEHEVEIEPANAQIYFSIYFLMTGLHGIHVVAGIGAFVWLLMCAHRGDFNGGHFTRVDMVALYWHLVDLIWIYLFLLLYLID
jgi:cytochrome c oxidase subunit 3